ncbi:MAG: 2-oxoisovalerate dehydrogenase E1 [Rhodothalassiaceae bacterium]|nr:MAG: 2-oxoisovalerate dehydrogenase E1 [Rhodothalassiaceae bacterium]
METPPLARLFRMMARIRAFEDALMALWREGGLPGLLHACHGLEALAAGVLAHFDRELGDVVTSTHRPDAHALACGLDMATVAAEILGRSGGLNGGRGGQMHLLAPAQGFFGANGIVGGSVPIAVGAALARRLKDARGIAFAFMGDGALNQGAVLESLNLAAIWRLPVLFVVEDNGWHEFTPRRAATAGNLAARLAAVDIPVREIDGGDVQAVWHAAGEAVAAIRTGGGPQALIAAVPRLLGHHSADEESYRKADPPRIGGPQDPLVRAAAVMEKAGLAAEAQRLAAEAGAEVAEAIEVAWAYPPADPSTSPAPAIPPAVTDRRPEPLRGAPAGPERMTLAEALRHGLAEAMARDPDIVILGEDVEEGAFGVTRGLADRFGRPRVRNTPISEAAFLGAALGAAAAGLKPVVEVMFADFAAVGMDQIVNQIAKWRYSEGARRPLPLVIRMAAGAGIAAGMHHSQNMGQVFAATAGLKCLYPSAPGDALRALKAALVDPDPVILLEPKALYDRPGAVEPDAPALEDGRIRVWTEGDAAAIVALGPMVPEALAAAERLAGEGIPAAVIEPLWLAPLPLPALVAALEGRRHVVIVDEGAALCGLADALAARLAAALRDGRAAPPLAVTPPHAPVPFAPALEAAWRPDRARIAAAVRRLVTGGKDAPR